MGEISTNDIKSIPWTQSAEYQKNLQAAEAGDVDAMCLLGEMAASNESFEEAGRWFLRAAKKGTSIAYYRLGFLYESGKLTDASNPAARIVKYYGISAVLGNRNGQKKLGDCYFEGKYGLEKNNSLATDWYTQAAERNNPEAALLLGNLSTDRAKAKSWYRQAANGGLPEGQYKLAMLSEDSDEKERLFEDASNGGYLPASMELANCYLAKNTPEYNKASYNLFSKVFSERAEPEAAVKMAEMIIGRKSGIAADYQMAKKLVDFAGQRHHPEALFFLSRLFWNGNDELHIAKDMVKANSYLRAAADKGHAVAAFNVGAICRDQGNDTDAKKYYKIAAENGHIGAKTGLAELLWKSGQYNDAISLYEQAAEAHNESAQVFLGRIYSEAKQVARDYAKAIRYYSMSPSCNNAASQLAIGKIYASGADSFKKNEKEAYNWFLRAAIQGDVEAEYQVGNALRCSSEAKDTKAEALQWLEKAAQKGHVDALVWAGLMYKRGQGTKDERPDYEKARQYYSRGAELGSSSAKNNLAILYDDGLGVKKDLGKAFGLYLEAAKAGIGNSIKQVARMYRNGTSPEKNAKEAFRWNKEDADKHGTADSAFYTAEAYRTGALASPDEKSALKYYEIAAKGKHVQASDLAGYMYYCGKACDRDLSKAKQYLTIAAEGGITRAQFYLAELLRIEGKDVTASINWYEKAAAQDDEHAQYQLGEIYRKGENKNPQKALTWYEKAAGHGCLEAIECVGHMYELGEGIEDNKPDYAQARSYYQQAIDMDSAFAMERMGLLLYNGTAGAADRKRAFELFYDAAIKGNRPVSQRYLASMYQKMGAENNLREAFFWYESSARNGDTESMYQTAEMLRTGNGTEENGALAFEFYEKAAKMKHPEACNWAGYYLLNGINCKQDSALAKNYFTTAAEAQIPQAVYFLGEILYSEKDYKKAILEFQKAAGLNYVYAFTRLGKEYSTGVAVEQNVELAKQYLRYAASVGSIEASAILGRILWMSNEPSDASEAVGLISYVLNQDLSSQVGLLSELSLYMGDAYMYGKGIAPNASASLEYYKTSASVGNTEAMVKLANIYREGKIVEKNKATAHMWMENAARLGNEDAKRKTSSVFYKLFG